MDPSRLDATFDRWFAEIFYVVGGFRTAAAERGAEYVSNFTAATPAPPLRLSERRLSISMHVLTVATIKRAMVDGMQLRAATELGRRRGLGGAERHVLDAQRSVITQTSVESDEIIGWRRVGVGDCDFCRMLIGRGAVYTESTADFKSHDHCTCLAEPETALF